MQKQKIIACNWKMNKTSSQAVTLLTEIKENLKPLNCNFIVFPPFTALEAVNDICKKANICLGAQNCHWQEKGAFTGEISVEMLKELNVKYVIIGHSERRQYFAETDETINKKIKSVINAGLKAVLCVGETLEQREQGIEKTHIENQIKADLIGISSDDCSQILIAYEPIWAIGTGKTATSQQAEEMCKFIRDSIVNLYSEKTAENINILYGGSMNGKNAKELLNQKNIDGGLIGGASLKPQEISEIANNCK